MRQIVGGKAVQSVAAPASAIGRFETEILTRPGKLFPRVGFSAINRNPPDERVLACYNGGSTVERHAKEGKFAL